MEETVRRSRFPLTPDAPRRARGWAAMVDVPPDARDTLLVLISELVTAGVRNGDTDGAPVELSIRRSPNTIRVEVLPETGRPIEVDPASPERSGLRIVDALADRWGVMHGPSGLWFELDV